MKGKTINQNCDAFCRIRKKINMAEGGCGLDPVLCDLCEDKAAQFYCRTCDGNMCIECKDDHKRKKMFLRHDVVKMTLTRKMEVDGYGHCNVHPENKYELSCQACQIPVCTKCIAGEHNGHKMKDISTAYLEAKRRISEIINEVDCHLIPTYKRNMEDLETLLGDVKKQSRELEQTVVKQSQKLKDFIQSIEIELLQKICSERTSYGNQINTEKNDIENSVSHLQTLHASLEKKRDTKIMTDLILFMANYSELEKNKIFQIPSFQPACFITNFPYKNVFRVLFGLHLPSRMVIQKRKRCIMAKAKEIKNIGTTVVSPIGLFVSDQNQGIVWVRGIKATVHKVDMQGNVQTTVSTQTEIGRPSGLIETKDGIMFYTDVENKKIRRVAKDLREENEINTEWYPMGMCISLSGHILVCVAYLSVYESNETDVGKILRMNCQGDIFQQIEKNSDNENLFIRPICISENNNQDICVSDCKKKSLIVVNRTGGFRFAYEGNFIKNDDRIFEPAELDTDKDGNILIADEKNNLVHLLDIDGRFLQYILTTKDGVSKPRGLKVDDEDRLWLTEIDKQRIKVFQYLE